MGFQQCRRRQRGVNGEWGFLARLRCGDAARERAGRQHHRRKRRAPAPFAVPPAEALAIDAPPDGRFELVKRSIWSGAHELSQELI